MIIYYLYNYQKLIKQILEVWNHRLFDKIQFNQVQASGLLSETTHFYVFSVGLICLTSHWGPFTVFPGLLLEQTLNFTCMCSLQDLFSFYASGSLSPISLESTQFTGF